MKNGYAVHEVKFQAMWQQIGMQASSGFTIEKIGGLWLS
jgi:hypothetical protein